MKFTYREKKDLFNAGILISLAFAFLLGGGFNSLLNLNLNFLVVFITALFTAGVGFLLHELMHKYVAQSYGLFAEFKAFYNMLWFAIVLSLFGFIIAAPGAVMISGRVTKEKNGKISLAGPMTNIVLAFVFLILILVLNAGGIFRYFLGFGLTINSLLAAFNMIPIMPFDGAKVIEWNKIIYSLATITAVGLFIVSFLI